MRKWILIALIALCGMPAHSQEVSAGITGRITDPSGAAIVNATVIAKDVQRGAEWPTKTNEEGVYAFPRIPVGRYDLRVSSAGFKTVVRSGITLEVNQRARLDIALEVGALAETVTVSGEAALLQTESTLVGAVIASKTIVNTPLISRNPIALTLLAPGVVATDPSSFNNGQRTSGGGRPYVNGNRKEANNFLLDGVDNNQVSDNLSSYQPNLDAIQEFNMITNNASAEFGNFQGGIVNVIIKSGTNEYHGSVFEYFRNDKLNANNWGRNWNNQPRAAMRWNQFGGTIGGPVFRDRLFFFADYQGLRRHTPPSVSATTLMPEEWRRGDFSRLLNPAYSGVAAGIQLYNPFSLDENGNRAPFANNQIPMSMFSPVVQKLFSDQALYPLPQIAGTARASDPNYYYATASQLKSDQGDFKLDWKVSSKDDFSGRYSNGRQDTPGITTLPFQYDSFNIAPFQNGVVNWTRTINPTLVNEARLGVNNIMLNNGGQDRGLGDIAQKLGIQAAGSGLLSLQGFAFTPAMGNANIGTQQLFANTTYHLADNFTIIRGHHMIKTGGQVMRQQMNTFYAGNNGRTGFMAFNGRFTQGPNAKSPTGKAVGEADFLLGLPSNIGRGLSTGTWGHRKTIFGFYFQDDWRATGNLTLNLGLRWEYHTPLVEVKDRQSNFDPFTGALLLAGQNGNSRALYAPFKKDFQPRIGFAYTPSVWKKMVIRGAYTISSFMEGTGTNLRLPMNPPFNSEFEARYDSPSFVLPGSNLEQGLSALNPKDPYAGANIRLWDPFVRPANTQQWNLTMEFQLPAAQVFTLGYVGQKGTHLIVPMPYYQRRLQSDGTVLPSQYLSANPALKLITQISGTEACGNQRYDGLQATLRKRFSRGVEYQVSYTLSKGMSDAIGYYGEGGQSASQSAYWQNLYDRGGEWGPTYFDAKHNFVGSFVYELPVGRARAVAANVHPVVDGIIGGWQIGGIFSSHTGFPLTIQSSTDTSGTLSRGARADVVGTPNNPHVIGRDAKWFDITAFAIPKAGAFGNSGVGIVRGPGMARFDLSLGKRFRVTERRFFELRGEAFNLTNSPIFGAPNRSVQSAQFGEIRSAQGERNIQIVARFTF